MRRHEQVLLSISIALSLMSCKDSSNVAKGKIGGLYEANEKGRSYHLKNSNEQFLLDTLSFISFDDFDEIIKEGAEEFGKDYVLIITLNKQGTSKFRKMTERNLDKQIFLVKQNEIIVAGRVIEVIEDGKISLRLSDEETTNEVYNYLIK